MPKTREYETSSVVTSSTFATKDKANLAAVISAAKIAT